MPIRRYLEEGVFTPKTTSEMSKALEATVEILGIGRDEAKRRGVAKFIIRVAKDGDSLDAVALRDRAVAALGGAAYRDIAASAERAMSN
jgi:hypothetical protein